MDQATQAKAETKDTPAPVQQQVAASTPAQEVLPDGMKSIADGKVQVLSSTAFKKLRDESRERGKRSAHAELEQRAKAAGYSSVDELIMAAQLAKAQAAAGAAPNGNGKRGNGHSNGNGHRAEAAEPEVEAPGHERPPQPPKGSDRGNRQAWERYERDRTKWAAREANLRRKVDDEARKRRKLQQDLERREAESELRDMARRRGVEDVDYAVFLLRREIRGKSPDELKGFDEGAWFDSLRQSRPHIFSEVVRPATTGTSGGHAPPPLKPGQVAQQQAANGQIDVRTMPKQDYEAYLRKRGLSIPVL